MSLLNTPRADDRPAASTARAPGAHEHHRLHGHDHTHDHAHLHEPAQAPHEHGSTVVRRSTVSGVSLLALSGGQRLVFCLPLIASLWLLAYWATGAG